MAAHKNDWQASRQTSWPFWLKSLGALDWLGVASTRVCSMGRAGAKVAAAGRGRAKAAGAPKAKGRASPRGASQQLQPSPSTVPSTDLVLADQAAGAPLPKKPRAARRWDTEDSVERVVSTKLESYDEVEVQSCRGRTTGLSVDDFIATEIRRNRSGGERKNLAGDFWSRFFSEFALGGSRFSKLQSLDDGRLCGSVQDELVETMCFAHAQSPRERKVWPLTNSMEYLDSASLDDLKFLIEGARESPEIVRDKSLTMLMAILKLIGRLQLHITYPHFWKAIEHDMDQTFAAFVSGGAMGIRAEFVEGHKMSLAPLIPFDCLAAVESALAMDPPVDPPLVALERILTTNIGQTLYKAEGAKVQYRQYVQSISKRIDDLENLNFSLEDVQAFKTVMKIESKRVVRGLPAFVEKPTKVIFLGKKVELGMQSVNDEWSFRLESRMREIAVANNLVTRLPWEKALWGDQVLEGYPTTVAIDSSLLDRCENTRAAILKLFKPFDSSSMTFTK